MRLAPPRESVAEPVVRAGETRELLRLSEHFSALRAALAGGRAELAGARGGTRAGTLRLRSQDTLGLDPTVRAAALRSSAEINAVTTSYSPRGPAWSGSSVPNPTIGGVYDGSAGDQTLTFQVTRTGIVGTTAVRVDVFDEGGTRIDRLNVSASYTPGTPLALANGLTLALGTGLATLNDTFELDVSATVGSAIDPDKPFDGQRNNHPGLEPGTSIVDGSFRLNGIEIAVFADDSLTDVIARIEAAGAGVGAAFDATSERLVFTHDTSGAAGSIALTDDTSGFLAALKLTDAELEDGRDSDLEVALAGLGRAGLAAGTLAVNGSTRAFDPAVDSLVDVLDWLGDQGVSARYDAAADRLELTSSRSLELSDGATGFFASFGLATGPHVGPTQDRGFARGDEVRAGLAELAMRFNALLDASFEGTAGRQAGRLRAALETAVRTHFERELGIDEGARLRSRLGLDFQFEEAGGARLELDLERLESTLRREGEGLAEFLLGADDEGGLLATLESALRPGAAALGAILESRGLAALDRTG